MRKKFEEFQNDRQKVHELITSYVADYRQFNGKSDDRKEFLEKKYLPQAPSLSHLVFDEKQIYWNVNDIAIILGRTQQAISATLLNIEKSEGWISRLLPLRKLTKSANGNKIFVYSEEIFDLIIDRYEEEYLLRFSEPRRGSSDNAPDIQEVRRFWNYLKKFENHKNYVAVQEEETILPDVPPMNLKDILIVIWKKVFDIKIGTICSLFSVACFEIARRYFYVSLWQIIFPAIVLCAIVFLIHKRKFSADTLSNIGAGALLFLLLWISGILSLYKYEDVKVEQNLVLSPVLQRDGLDLYVNFKILATDFSDVKEIFFRISPDVNFRSMGFSDQINVSKNFPYPSTVIRNNIIYHDVAFIDVKYRDFEDKESEVWNFSFDIDAERFNLCKRFILSSNKNWFGIIKYNYNGVTDVFVDSDLLSIMQGKNSIKSFVYGINTDKPDTEIDFQYFYEPRQMSKPNPYAVVSVKDSDIKSVSSYLTFKDGTSSDIRVSRIQK